MRYSIEGGRPLEGEVAVDGSKNAALPILVATLLTDGEVVLDGVPRLRDVRTLTRILEVLGKRIEVGEEGVRVAGGHRGTPFAPPELVRRMRASFLVLGPLLARWGEAEVSLPGGDAIGMRPVDLHLRGLQAMGAELELRDGIVHARASPLRAAEIHLGYPSVGATEHLMMTAALVPGRSVVRNPAREPEVEDLGRFLRRLGAHVQFQPDHIEIEGKPRLGGAQHTVIPDRLCAGTYTLAAALTGGRVEIRCRPWHLRPLTGTLSMMNVEVEERSHGLVVTGSDARSYRPVEIETHPYPGFPTDMHPPIAPLLALTPGESRIRETVFEDRFAYAPGLRRMGANVRIWGQTAIVSGVARLQGAEVSDRRDNRAGVALVLAGLAAQGTTVVHDEADQIPRGHSDLAGTLMRLGARITAT